MNSLTQLKQHYIKSFKLTDVRSRPPNQLKLSPIGKYRGLVQAITAGGAATSEAHAALDRNINLSQINFNLYSWQQQI